MAPLILRFGPEPLISTADRLCNSFCIRSRLRASRSSVCGSVAEVGVGGCDFSGAFSCGDCETLCESLSVSTLWTLFMLRRSSPCSKDSVISGLDRLRSRPYSSSSSLSRLLRPECAIFSSLALIRSAFGPVGRSPLKGLALSVCVAPLTGIERSSSTSGDLERFLEDRCLSSRSLLLSRCERCERWPLRPGSFSFSSSR